MATTPRRRRTENETPKSLAAVIDLKRTVEQRLLTLPGVTGVDVGYKEVNGERTGQLAIRIMVAEKRSRDAIPEDQLVPREINGVPTDVIERTFELHQFRNRMPVDEIRLMADTGRYDPVKGGISIGPCRSVGGYVYAGTLGAIVRDNATGNTLLLSNFHVMCIDDGWHAGDQMAQPSRVDTGTCPADVAGTLERAVLSTNVDGAVCSLSGRGYHCSIVDIGNVAGTASAVMDEPVRKRGRTSGLSYGFIDSVSLSVKVPYGDGLGERTLTNQIGIRPDPAHNPSFGTHGDSGSVVVNADRKVVGLYFAGSDDGYGVANPIAAVLAELNISMCTPVTKIKEFKEIKELKREIKELKREKIEIKDFKREKLEIKERKPEKFEVEYKAPTDTGPKLTDVPPGWPPVEQPIEQPIGGPMDLQARLAQLEALVGQLQAFIAPELRPNLAMGALAGEQDITPEELTALSQQLAKNAADALQTKVEFDTKQ